MCEQNASYLAKHLELGSKNLNKICLKIIEKALTQPLQRVNFRIFSGGACPRPHLEHFLFLNQLQISSAEKNAQEKMWKLCPPPLLEFLDKSLPALVVR